MNCTSDCPRGACRAPQTARAQAAAQPPAPRSSVADAAPIMLALRARRAWAPRGRQSTTTGPRARRSATRARHRPGTSSSAAPEAPAAGLHPWQAPWPRPRWWLRHRFWRSRPRLRLFPSWSPRSRPSTWAAGCPAAPSATVRAHPPRNGPPCRPPPAARGGPGRPMHRGPAGCASLPQPPRRAAPSPHPTPHPAPRGPA
mmetsp:Transcript_76216/g.236830  ORF Transcript_76216/g.236830 Transcript_76216/m.236830 type:complete len:200 (-) Transcript_76216:775-1374(-)